ncbi:MAG: N-acetyltransferase [Alphaproteobacteria bacterium]|nr:MAG: N-acetyltransferase [Alphaproteobacteria bacterium]
MLIIEPERAQDEPVIETLLDEAFSPERRQRTAYRFRDRVAPIGELSFVLRKMPDGVAVGSIRFWPVMVREDAPGRGAGSEALLLGPVAVAEHLRGRGEGLRLIAHALSVAEARMSHPWVFLIGDAPYYGRAGFRSVLPRRFRLPGPVEPQRLLYRPLSPDAVPLPEEFTLAPLGEED